LIETDQKEKNRQALTKQLQRLGLSSSPEALIEWGNLLQGAGEVESAEESLAALRWIAKRAETRGIKLRFARDAQELAKAWAKKRAAEIDATEQLENTA
jgi:ribosomal protein S7